jgi:hypothetical protein
MEFISHLHPRDWALIISTILVYASMFRYIYSILKGRTKPNLVGWLLYQIATLCILISSYELGSVPTIMLSLAFAVTQLIVIILSFRYGFTRMERAEAVYFGISMVSLIMWVIWTHNPELMKFLELTDEGLAVLVLTTNTLIEIMWALAIFTKLYHYPETEDAISWWLGWLAWLFSLLALSTFAYQDVLYPAYILVTNFAIWILCFRKKPRWRLIHVFTRLEKIIGKSWR